MTQLKITSLCITVLILSLTFIHSSALEYNGSALNVDTGDIDGDGAVTIYDATEIQRSIARRSIITGEAFTAADIDRDGMITISDATLVQKYLCYYNTGTLIDRFRMRKKYGVIISGDQKSSVCKRIDDAEGMNCDYMVEGQMQNGGKNDFDDCYPWCYIRRCNVAVNKNGTRDITYEGENGFSVDGSNGSVYVEIPKFYSKRSYINGEEAWEISGTKHEGFELEPAFQIGGKELDTIYVSAYECTNGSEYASVSGAETATNKSLAEFRAIAHNEGAVCFDYAALHAIQMLYVIEFADTNTDKYMQGFSMQPYLNYSNGKIVSRNRHTLTVERTNGSKATRVDNLRVGQRVRIYRSCPNDSMQNWFVGSQTTIVKILPHKTDSDLVDITLKNIPDEDIVGDGETTYYISGQPQSTGGTDTLTYHTGRASRDNSVSVFKYRHMENLWGNAWKIVEGLRTKELNYYYTFDPERYDDKDISSWQKYSMPAPNQPHLGDNWQNKAWIKSLGYDKNQPLPLLPVELDSGNTKGDSSRWSSALYTMYDVTRNGKEIQKDKDAEYVCLYGGGWDHGALCGLFTFRFWVSSGDEASALHTTRTVIR